MKRYRVFLTMLMTGCMLLLAMVPYAIAAPVMYTHAEAAALIDVTSGRILYSHNGDKPMRIASLTKIMTAIVAIESGNLSDKVKVGMNAFAVEGSSIYLKLGEEMSLQHLLYGLMLRSGNDAAMAIAEHVGGSAEGFIKMMNDKAEQLGMSHSLFKNPHGLDAIGHLSTANDMAVLTAYALKNPVFRDIVKTPSIKVPNPGEKWDRQWRNKNKMLQLYPGADGVKTGYTKTAKRCLVSSASQGAQQLAAVTLNDGDDWVDHVRLLNFGFQQYPLRVLYEASAKLPDTDLMSPYSLYYPMTDEEFAKVSLSVSPEPELSLSGRFGVRATAQFKLGGNLIGQLPLYTKDDPAINRIQKQAPVRYTASEPVPLIRDNAVSMMKRLLKALFTAPVQL